MFSYTSIAKQFQDPEVFSYGQKLYLDGAIVSKKNLILDFWREYEVVSENKLYKVRLPLLHLALDRIKFDNAFAAASEVVSCECEYFFQNGFCKHLAAVFVSLDKEFGFDKKNKKIEDKVVLENIFQVEGEKQNREFRADFEYCLNTDFLTGSEINNKLGKLVAKIGLYPEKYVDFLKSITPKINKIIGDYTAEKKLIKIIANGLLLKNGGQKWFDFWMGFVKRLDEVNQVNLWVSLWKICLIGVCKNFEESFISSLKALNVDLKRQVLEELKKEFSTNEDNWIKFIFAAEYKEWLSKNIEQLGHNYLILTCKILPEDREKIENLILGHAKLWADFLQVGDYKEVIDFFKTWSKEIGKSEQYEDAKKHFLEVNRKRKKLVKLLETV